MKYFTVENITAFLKTLTINLVVLAGVVYFLKPAPYEVIMWCTLLIIFDAGLMLFHFNKIKDYKFDNLTIAGMKIMLETSKKIDTLLLSLISWVVIGTVSTVFIGIINHVEIVTFFTHLVS